MIISALRDPERDRIPLAEVAELRIEQAVRELRSAIEDISGESDWRMSEVGRLAVMAAGGVQTTPGEIAAVEDRTLALSQAIELLTGKPE